MQPLDLDTLERPTSATDLRTSVLTLALRALGGRVLTWIAAIGAGAAWTITVLQPEPWRIVASACYALTVLVPILWMESRRAT